MNRVIASIVLLLAGAALAATTFTGRLILVPDWSHQKTDGASTAKETFDSFDDWTTTTGTNANQMTTIAMYTVALTNSETNIVFNAASCTNSFGDAVTFAVVRFMCFTAATGNIDVVSIGGAAANTMTNWVADASDKINLRPGGTALFVAPDFAGYAVGGAGVIQAINTGTNTATVTMYVGGSE